MTTGTRGTRAHGRRGASAAALTALLLTVAAQVPASAATTEVRCAGHDATIVGTPGDDILTGTPGRDVIAGLGGNDTVSGLGGDDLICGDAGNDTLDGGTGSDDVLVGGSGDDHLSSASEVSTVRGGPGDDVETSSSPGLVRFVSEPGDDTFTTTTATIAAFDLARSPVGVALHPIRGILRSKRGHSTVHLATGTTVRERGTRFGDVLFGTNGDDRVNGGPGNDRIATGPGDDRVTGGKGKNFLFAGRGRDVLFENHRSGFGRNDAWAGSGDDVMRFGSNDGLLGGPGDDLISSVMRADQAIGVEDSHGQNTVILRLHPKAPGQTWSHATLDLGRAFHAQLVLPGREPLTFFAKVAVLRLDVAHARSWTVNGTPRADVLLARHGSRPGVPVVMHGFGGDDELVTGRGPDHLDGGPGHDRGYAGPGRDACTSIEAAAPGHPTTSC